MCDALLYSYDNFFSFLFFLFSRVSQLSRASQLTKEPIIIMPYLVKGPNQVTKP